MPKIKIPKSSPSIDMTPMVDLAFLLVTFFMLAANFRDNEPIQVVTPSSTDATKEIPQKSTVMVTVDEGGRAFFNCLPPDGNFTMKEDVLKQMCSKYKIQLTQEQVEEFNSMASFGCPMRDLSKYLEMTPQERQVYSRTPGFKGIPTDSLNNELKMWIDVTNRQSTADGAIAYKEAKTYDESVQPNDYKPKFILKVDGKAEYAHAKKVIDIFRDLNLNNLNFITSTEAASLQQP